MFTAASSHCPPSTDIIADSVQSYNVSGFRWTWSLPSSLLLTSSSLFLPPLSPPLAGELQNEDSERFKTMVVFDCRGVEPFDFSPRVSVDGSIQCTHRLFDELSLILILYSE